jgi:hypothetical protein
MLKKEFHYFVFLYIKMNTNEDICIERYLSFLTVHIFHGSKLTGLCIALNIGNSDHLVFLSYFVWR